MSSGNRRKSSGKRPKKETEEDKVLIKQILAEEDDERVKKENETALEEEAAEAEFQKMKKEMEQKIRERYGKESAAQHKKDSSMLKQQYEKMYDGRLEKSCKEMSKMDKITVLQTEEALYTRHNYNITYLQMEKGAYSVFCKTKKGSESMVAKITDLKKAPKFYKKCLMEEECYKPLKWIIKNRNSHIVTCYETFIVGDKFFFFQESLIDSLETYLKSGKSGAKEEKARQIIRDVGEGLLFLHANGIAHRDLCARNVLVDKKANTVKIGGLNCLVAYWSVERKEPKKFAAIHDTDTKYISPEEKDGDDIDAAKADIWGLGATAVYTVCREYPPATEFEVFGSNKLSHVSEAFMDLMKKTMVKAAERPTIVEFLCNRYFVKPLQ